MGWPNIDKNIASHKHHFPFDYFYGTWENRKTDLDRLSSFLTSPIILTPPEPTIHYHPILENTVIPFLRQKTQQSVNRLFEKSRKHHLNNKVQYERGMHRTKQILGHAHMLSQLPEEYDVVIRSRYDTRLNLDVDFSPLLEQSYKEQRAIGFGASSGRFDEACKKFNQLEVNVKAPLAYMSDFMIMHPREMFDVDQVRGLHKNKQLLSAEVGWYQVLSYPYGDNHINILGGAMLERLLNNYKNKTKKNNV